MSKLNQVECFLRKLVRLSDFSPAKTKSHIFQNGHVGEERVALKNSVDRTLIRRRAGDVFPANQNLALGGFFETRDKAKRGRLATTAGAQQGKE